MSHRAIPLTVSEFDNHQHAVWENPFTGTVTTASFVDLFNQAQQEANDTLLLLFSDDFSLEKAKEIYPRTKLLGVSLLKNSELPWMPFAKR